MKSASAEYLFDAASKLIKESLADISEEDVRDSCDYKIFMRGMEYFQEGMVESLFIDRSNNTLNAIVNGSREYQIEFCIHDKGVYSTCDCHYNGVCKHTVAALLYIIHEGIDHIGSLDLPGQTSEKSMNFLEEYLDTLFKDDLIRLVIKFAPKSYIKEIHNRKVNANEGKTVLNKAEKKIRKFFEDDDLLYDPEGMEAAILKELDSLKGLEKHFSVEIGELLLFIIRNIEDAFNKGYLYIDNNYDDDFFESEAFCEYVIAFVRQLPTKEKISYLRQLNQALDEMSYDTFQAIGSSYHRLFSEEEKEDLKLLVSKAGIVSDSLLSRLYETLESSMNESEQEASLRIIGKHDPDHFTTLCSFLFGQGRFREVYDLITEESGGLYKPCDIQVATIYLEAAHKLSLDMDKVSDQVVNKCPQAPVLHKIKALKGTVGKSCEETVRLLDPEELLLFYEEENRLKDALSLVMDPDLFYDEVVFVFFKKNRNHFPAETEAYLKNRIEKNLSNTSKVYYERIAESLDLMNRINPERSRRIAEEIRANFKRRTNLIQMIRRF